MNKGITRRRFLLGSGGLATLGLAMGASGLRNALASMPELTIVEWGGPTIKATKEIAKKWGKAGIDWVLYTGGSASILPKIKSQWPNPQYNILDSWDPVFNTMIHENWLETLTLDDVPNLKHVPEDLITKDASGNWKTVPTRISGGFFGYRKDICPIKIRTIDDLLDPKLKGQLCWPAPIENENLQVVALALHGGGSEYDMEPGWDFLKKLAKSGNIGLVAHTEQEFINAMTTGQVSAAFWNAGPWGTVARRFPCELLTKVPDQAGMKTFIWTEGWCVLRGTKHRKTAMDFMNFGISASMDQLMCQIVALAPSNKEAKAPSGLGYMVFGENGLKEYTYRPDYNYISKHIDGWQKRFETEIEPLLGA